MGVHGKYQVGEQDFAIDGDVWKYIGDSVEVIIPKAIGDRAVTEIPAEAFANTGVERVIIPDTVKIIDEYAFSNCHKLSQITIPEGVEIIGECAFLKCTDLSRISLPKSVAEIKRYAFAECSRLERIKLPRKINNIGAFAFSDTNIERIIFPGGIEYLHNSLFLGCRNLKEVTLQNGLKSIGLSTFQDCISLKIINLPDSIEEIAAAAFSHCIALRSIRLPKNLKVLSDTAFEDCINLATVQSHDIYRLVLEYDLSKLFETGSGAGDKTNTIYNILTKSIYRPFSVVPIEEPNVDTKKSAGSEEIREYGKSKVRAYEDILYEGIDLKMEGKYEAAKEKYIEAIKIDSKTPTAYYNLGKILYILGDYEASVRSYKVAFDKGVYNLMLGFDMANFLNHLGHSLLDPHLEDDKYKEVVLLYSKAVDPYFFKKANQRDAEHTGCQPSEELISEYTDICIKAAKEYLGIK